MYYLENKNAIAKILQITGGVLLIISLIPYNFIFIPNTTVIPFPIAFIGLVFILLNGLIKKDDIIIFVVLILFQFQYFLSNPFNPDGGITSAEKIHNGIVLLLAGITLLFSIFMIIKKGLKNNYFYVISAIFYILFFILIINSGNYLTF